MDEKFWASVKWRQSERHAVLEVVWMGWIEGFGAESACGCRVSGTLHCDFVCGSVSTPQFSPLLLPQCTTLESLCKVTEGQTQPSLMVSTELLVQASLDSSNSCWHCDLEPLVLEESSLLRATVGRGEQRVCPKRLSEILFEAADHWPRANGLLNYKGAHTACWELKVTVWRSIFCC